MFEYVLQKRNMRGEWYNAYPLSSKDIPLCSTNERIVRIGSNEYKEAIIK
jgi:hypothetical protein